MSSVSLPANPNENLLKQHAAREKWLLLGL